MESPQRFCIWCGHELRQGGRFCTTCGRATADASQATPLVAEGQMPVVAPEAVAAPEVTATRQMGAGPGPTGVSSTVSIGNRTPEVSYDDPDSAAHPGWPGDSAPYGGASPQQPRRRRSRWPVVASLIVLLCAAGAASVIFVLHPFRGSRPPSAASPARSPLASPASSTFTSPASAASAAASQQVSPEASATLPSTVGVVAISSSVANDPQAQSVAGIFNTYFSSINQHHYEHALSVFDPASPLDPSNPLTVSSLAREDATTTDSNIALTEVRPSGNGLAAEAALTFQSQQAAGYGPAGSPNQTCTVWHLRYTLTQPSGSYLIYKVKGTHTRC
jgi:hypothetical protein